MSLSSDSSEGADGPRNGWTRRDFLRVGSVSVALATAGCDWVPKTVFPELAGRPERKGPFVSPSADTIDLVSHALNRLTFGGRPGDYERILKVSHLTPAVAKAMARRPAVASSFAEATADKKAMARRPALSLSGEGIEQQRAFQAFIEEQLHPDRIEDAYCQRVMRRFEETLNEPIGELFEYQEKFLLEQMTRAAVLRATLSERQLFEIMVQFWTDHFNIDPSKGDCKWLKAADDRLVIREHALGSFPEMLKASALSPAMLWYLDGRVNRKEKFHDKPNENYARELLELHTLGVHGGYTQADVMEVARCLTGWTVRSKEPMRIGQVEFNPKLHDNGSKLVLGRQIPSGLGEKDLERVLEIVALHPSTAKHIAFKLCRHFIADEPPAAAVSRVAETFLDTAGDIPDTLRTLFNTEEFQSTRGNKLKRPFHFVVSALRVSDAETDGGQPVLDYLLRMGHAPFHYPTPDGYPEQASPWMGTLLWRWNFAVALNDQKIKGTTISTRDLRKSCGGDTGLMAHCFGRRPTAAEMESYKASGAGLALVLAAPAFQAC